MQLKRTEKNDWKGKIDAQGLVKLASGVAQSGLGAEHYNGLYIATDL